MLRDMSNIELAAWFADARVGTLDDEKADARMAVIATAAWNGPHFMRDDKKPYEPSHFIPKRPGDEARKAEELSKQIRSIFTGMGK